MREQNVTDTRTMAARIRRQDRDGDAVSTGLDAATLAVFRALDAAEVAAARIDEDARRSQWALHALGAVALPTNGVWCVGTAERFLAVGGPGWGLLGYAPDDLEGHAWESFLADAQSVADSRKVVSLNLSSGRGVGSFVNRYRAKDGVVRSIVWRISPWHDGMTVAYGEVEET